MAIICYDVDNLILKELSLQDISQLVQTKKYWMRRMGWLVDDYMKVRWTVKYGYQATFKEACGKDLLRLCKWYWETWKPSIQANDLSYALSKCCGNGYMDMVKWLWEISNHTIDYRSDKDYAFKNCISSTDDVSTIDCRLNVAKWLCTIEPDYYLEISPKVNGCSEYDTDDDFVYCKKLIYQEF